LYLKKQQESSFDYLLYMLVQARALLTQLTWKIRQRLQVHLWTLSETLFIRHL